MFVREADLVVNWIVMGLWMLIDFRLVFEVLPDLLSGVADYDIMFRYSILVDGRFFKI